MAGTAKNWKQGRRFQPLFFLFLILGPFVVLPFLILLPAITTLRSAWGKTPSVFWRFGVVASIVVATMMTQPSSPMFLGLDAPIPPIASPAGPLQWLLELNRPYLNAAIIALFVLLPLSAASTLQTISARRRIKTNSAA